MKSNTVHGETSRRSEQPVIHSLKGSAWGSGEKVVKSTDHCAQHKPPSSTGPTEETSCVSDWGRVLVKNNQDGGPGSAVLRGEPCAMGLSHPQAGLTEAQSLFAPKTRITGYLCAGRRPGPQLLPGHNALEVLPTSTNPSQLSPVPNPPSLACLCVPVPCLHHATISTSAGAQTHNHRKISILSLSSPWPQKNPVAFLAAFRPDL